MQPQQLDVQHGAPASMWAAGGIAALTFLTALHFFPFVTLTAVAAVLIPARFITWLRR
ncbi:hypothetical protein [Thiomonas sp.]|jgi:hypothetical protein|uniref:hypothetical protein n=1 Tax=Thiomonas sp. TaxID=2047785 RepID=UPI00258DEBA2|nr:hypothetical protein [Thiomonas sp.]